MNKYNFDVLAKRKNTNSVKYDEFDSSLPMWVADMDFVMAPAIRDAIQKDLDVGAIGYTTIPNAFFEAFINYYKDKYSSDFLLDDMAYVSGVVASIDSMLKELCEKGDSVLMFSPVYHTFYHCIENNGFKVKTAQLLLNDGKYDIDWLNFERLLKEKDTKVFLLCNPHNPVGKIFTEEELKKIDELASKYGVFVISDEIHGLLTNPGKKYIPYSNIAKGKWVSCLATSKAFNLAGLQSAVIVCKDKQLKEQFQDAFYRDDIGEPNYFAVNANIAALNDSRDYLDELNAYVYKNKCEFKRYLEEHLPKVTVHLTDATYMVWVDVREFTNDTKAFTQELNKKTGLLVSPGIQFGPGGEGFLRINLATSLENVLDAAKRLERFIKN